ncbi:MAG: hypothetical protein K0Q78_2890 [Cellvibrio sp.]|nr:hypothetical protein [Cellvibrio sp.]
MTDEHKSTRIGDLLVERGVITRAQLTHAVELQQIRRQHAIKVNAPNSYTQGLGELLIELGFPVVAGVEVPAQGLVIPKLRRSRPKPLPRNPEMPSLYLSLL